MTAESWTTTARRCRVADLKARGFQADVQEVARASGRGVSSMAESVAQPQRVSRTRTVAAWIPLALLVTAAATGWWNAGGPVQSAGASEVEVTGSVAANLFLDTGDCSAASVAIGEMVPGLDPWKTAQDESGELCRISFGTTNHAAGTDLVMYEDPAAPAAPADAMKCVTTCPGAALDDYQGASEPAAGSSAFGAQLLGVGGVARGLWSQPPAVNEVGDTGVAACRTLGVGTGSCSFTWGATAATSDGPGDYQAQVSLLVLAR